MTLEGVEKLPENYAIGDGTPTLVRNWFGTDGTIKDDCLSVNDRVRDLLDNKEAQGMLKLAAGNTVNKWYVKLLRPFRVKTLLKIAGIDPQMTDIINGFLQTIKKR